MAKERGQRVQEIVAFCSRTLVGVEGLTAGWGMDVHFFRTPVLDDLTPLGRVVVVSAVLLAMSGLGAVLGAVMVRWGAAGVWWLVAGLGLLGGVAAVAVASAGGLGALAAAPSGRPWTQVWVLLPLVCTALCATAAWLTARRVALR